MNTEFSFDTYLSPFTWRYGSREMKNIWSEKHKRELLREVWCALATAQNKCGIVSDDELNDLISHKKDIDIQRALEIESDIHHDLMAEIKTYEEQCKIGGGKIHLGATSTDALDNAEAVREKEAISLLLKRITETKEILNTLIDENMDVYCMAYTHIQSAEETLLSGRFAIYKQSILDAEEVIKNITVKGKGFKGAVGNYSSYDTLYSDRQISKRPFSPLDAEEVLKNNLRIDVFDLTTQVYPRYQDLIITNALSVLGAVTAKIAIDLRVLQSSPFGEVSEYFSKNQVGSSAMPFKKNPINAEKISSLSRMLFSYTSVAFQNASDSILERTLCDSANRRIIITEAFLTSDEILLTLNKVLSSLYINKDAIKRNLQRFGVYSATERLLMKCTKKGGNRQFLHEEIRKLSLKARDEENKTGVNNLSIMLSENKEFLKYFRKNEILSILSEKPTLKSLKEKIKVIRKK